METLYVTEGVPTKDVDVVGAGGGTNAFQSEGMRPRKRARGEVGKETKAFGGWVGRE